MSRTNNKGKALKEGCHERRRAWAGMSPMEEIVTNRDLARATARSRA